MKTLWQHWNSANAVTVACRWPALSAALLSIGPFAAARARRYLPPQLATVNLGSPPSIIVSTLWSSAIRRRCRIVLFRETCPRTFVWDHLHSVFFQLLNELLPILIGKPVAIIAREEIWLTLFVFSSTRISPDLIRHHLGVLRKL